MNFKKPEFSLQYNTIQYTRNQQAYKYINCYLQYVTLKAPTNVHTNHSKD
jgi:hypothetical protein